MTSAILFWLAIFFGVGAVGCAILLAVSRSRAMLSARNLYAALSIALLIGSAVLS